MCKCWSAWTPLLGKCWSSHGATSLCWLKRDSIWSAQDKHNVVEWLHVDNEFLPIEKHFQYTSPPWSLWSGDTTTFTYSCSGCTAPARQVFQQVRAVTACLPCYRTEVWCCKLACKSPDTFQDTKARGDSCVSGEVLFVQRRHYKPTKK